MFLSRIVCSSAILCPCRARSPRSSVNLVLAGAQRAEHARLEEETSLEWRRAQTARLLLPWPRVRARRVGRPSRRTEWRQGLGRLIDAMDRSVEDLGPEPPAWWQRGQPMQLTMATVAEHVVVQEDIAMTAVAEPAGDEPAAAGDGAGDDEPAEPCTKRRKTHVPPEVKEWFCSLTRVMPDWTMRQCFRFAKRALPSFFEHLHIDTPRRWFSHKTPGTALGRPRSLEPAAVLALADIVSRVCSRVCCGAGVLAELLNAHLETLGHRSVPLLRTPYTPIHAITWVLLQETQGRAREGVARSNDTDTPRTVPTEDRVDIERCWHHRSQPHHQHRRDVLQDVASARTRVARQRRTARRHGHAPQHHRVPRHQASRARRVCPTHFPGQDLRRGTRQPLPIAAHHLSFGEPLDDDDDPHSLPHMAGHHCHEPRWQQHPMDLLHGRVYRARQPRVPGPPSGLTHAHIRLVFVPPNTTAVCQPLDRAYMRPFKAALGRYSARYIGREIQHHPDDVASFTHSIAGMRSLIMRWTHDALKEIATMRHNTAAWSGIVCTDAEGADVLALATARHIAGTLFKHHRGLPAPELRTDADAGEADDVPVHEDPPDVFPDLFEEEDEEPDMPEHEVPEPEDAHEEAPVPVLNRFLALRIVYGDGLRRMPSVG